MYNVFFPEWKCFHKTVIKIDSTKSQNNKRCVLTQTASLHL